MGKQILAIVAGPLFSGLLLAIAILAQSGLTMTPCVLGGGGGHVEAGDYALDGTIGQAVVGQVDNLPYTLCSGFWCGAAVEYKIYLPLVLRNA